MWDGLSLNLSEFKAIIKLVMNDLKNINSDDKLSHHKLTKDTVGVIIDNTLKIFPDYTQLLKSTENRMNMLDYQNFFYVSDAIQFLTYLQKIIAIREIEEIHLKEGKIFDSVYDKITQAGEAFRNNNYPATLNSLNTALELMVKDKFNIPSTMKMIKTSNVIEIAVKHKLGPYAYLDEANNKVVSIDNKIKHQAYVPSQTEAINAIGIIEEVFRKLQNLKIEVPEDVQTKIYQNLYT